MRCCSTGGRRAVSLTQAGERLLERGSALLRDMEDMKLEVKRLGQGAEGRLRIGFVGSSTFGILPTIIKSFRANFPEVNLSLAPMNNAQLNRSLIGREIDIAFARPALQDAEFRTLELGDEPLIAATPDTVATQRSGLISIDELRDQSFILYPKFPRPSYADLVLDCCETHGLNVRKTLVYHGLTDGAQPCFDWRGHLYCTAIGQLCFAQWRALQSDRARVRPHVVGVELSLG